MGAGWGWWQGWWQAGRGGGGGENTRSRAKITLGASWDGTQRRFHGSVLALGTPAQQVNKDAGLEGSHGVFAKGT